MNKFYKLISFYFKSKHSDKVENLFGRWLIEDAESEQKAQAMEALWNEVNAQADDTTLQDLERIHAKIDSFVPQRRPSLALRLGKVAAMIAMPLLFSWATYHYTKEYYITNSAMIEMATAYGESKQIVLPDGTSVWLSPGSTLTYPKLFLGKERNVSLNGEAIFKVAKDPNKRLIVKTNNIEVEALGTVFSVVGYRDLSKTTVTLEEGKVRVGIHADKPTSLILAPNEQVTYDSKGGDIVRRKVNAERMALRKDRYLVFQEASLVEILHAIEKKHGVVFNYDYTKYENRFFTLKFTPDESLESMLEVLSEVNKDFHFKIKDKTIFVF
ncbi:FecR family protein [Sphingobacterium sp. SYP-B4668]|uniref:FecR family protein n=1 Tax=Sphingobacterium sp. SYP-B4668 TaxID=2996035 RepID=UPI0022DD799A|nr:FecR family protein [Sphingobacterium sp. SYP-B4668]